MQPTTETTAALTVTQQLARVPLPAAMFGTNLSNAITEAAELLAGLAPITDEKSRLAAEAVIKQANGVVKVAGEKRLGITRILDAVKGEYTTAEKEQTGELVKLARDAGQRVTNYLREQQQKADEAAEAIRKQGEADLARKRSSESKATVAAATEEKLAEVQQAAPASGVKKFWTFEVVSADAVPDAYKVVDMAALKAAVSSGTREIPGVRIYQDIARSGR